MTPKRKRSIVLLILLASSTLLFACSARRAAPTGTPPSPSPSAMIALPVEIERPSPTKTVEPLLTQEAQNPEPAPPLSSPTSLPEPSTQPPAPALSEVQHTVQPGETLFGLATNYGVSMAAIQLANDMGDSIDLVAGQTLVIPGGLQWTGESRFWVVHTIRTGETLIGIASAHDLTVDEILQVNAIADPALLHIGQRLVLPLRQLAQVAQPTATPVAVAAAPAAVEAPSTLQTETPEEPPQTTPAPAATESPPTLPPPGPPGGEADWPNYILTRINQARAEHGLNTLAVAPELVHAAQAHAQDCAQRGWGSHVGSDGAVLKTRLERAGYFGTNWGENWVQALNAERAFDWWYGEIPPDDPHRRNILSPYYTEVGIGIAETDWGYIFITDFGRR